MDKLHNKTIVFWSFSAITDAVLAPVFISFPELSSSSTCPDYAHNSVAAIDLLAPQAEFEWIKFNRL